MPFLRSIVRAYRALRGRIAIDQYLKRSSAVGSPVKVVLGGHWSDHAGWLILNEGQQDITKPLAFPDGSVDALFLEHVIEHIPLVSALGFLVEAHRVLKVGGGLRLVCPTTDRIARPDFSSALGRTYVDSCIRPRWRSQDAAFKRVCGREMVTSHPDAFFQNSLFRDWGHEFIWSGDLLVHTLVAIGFTDARQLDVGIGRDPSHCLERRRRGIYSGSDWKEDASAGCVFDPESGVFEATKGRPEPLLAAGAFTEGESGQNI